MADERMDKDPIRKKGLGIDLVGETNRESLEQEEEQRRRLRNQVLESSKALKDALGACSVTKEVLLGLENSSTLKAATFASDSMTALLAELTKLTDPMRDYRDAFENSAISRIQEQMQSITTTSGINKIMADAESATARLMDSFKVDLPEIPSFNFPELDAMKRFDVSETYEHRSYLDYMPEPQFVEPLPPPEPGEAAKILAKLQEELDALNEEHANNPSQQPIIIVMLSDGKEIYVQTARNVGDQTIELTGLEFGSGDRRELTVGIDAVSFYTDVLDIGPKKPELKIVDNDTGEE